MHLIVRWETFMNFCFWPIVTIAVRPMPLRNCSRSCVEQAFQAAV
jgi:hypothetical protein